MIKSEEQKFKQWKKVTEFKESVGYKQISIHIVIILEGVQQDGESVWRNNGWKLSKFDERYEYKHPQRSTNFKWNELRDPH